MGLTAIIAGGLFLALTMAILAFSGPSATRARDRRIASIRERHAGTSEALLAAQMRRTISTTAQAGSTRSIGHYLPNRKLLEARLKKTGKGWSLNKYLWTNIGILMLVVILMTMRGMPVLFALAFGALVGLGLPHLVVNSLIKKRLKRFNAKFPDAIDLMVRGLKSGLPISETIGLVAQEIDGPIRDEFRGVVERIRIGKTMEAALQETADRIGTPELQFFVITLAIQRETGGNLAETLANLSDVLRKRAQMKLKIKAMSSEAKASAYIVGALPFFVFGIVYTTNPDYIGGFFYEPRLITAGVGGLIWMGIGVLMMKKMISFEI